jgi:alkylation response protein AidB-like acyl-CoA dehydrogenase
MLESCVLAPFLLATADSTNLQERWLPRMATGQARVSVGLGGSRVVPDVLTSDLLLLELAGEVVALERADFVAEPLMSMDPSRRMSRVSWRPGAGESLILPDLSGARARSLAGSAALLNGTGTRLIEMTVEYSKVRTQFGRPIGSFQAVKHQLAQATSLNALSQSATAAAVYSLARAHDDCIDAATLAHVCAVEAEAESNRVALQVHGGIGFTWEHHLQLWLKRGKTLEQAYGAHRGVVELAGLAGLDATPVRAV